MRVLQKILLVCLVVLLCGSPATAANLRIVAGTSLIEDIARDLSGGKSDILTLVPGSSCPGHDNARTQDFVFAAKADLVLIHGFQRNLPQLSGMMQAVDNTRAPLIVVDAEGSWLVPDNQRKAINAIAAVLKTANPEDAAAVEARAQARIALVDEAARQCAALLAPVRGKAVVAAQMQTEFVAWAGLKVLHSYGRAEDLSAKDLTNMMRAAQGQSIVAVIDNYQSGAEAGLPLALELGVPHLTLSNFPGSSASVPDYFTLLQANVALLAALP